MESRPNSSDVSIFGRRVLDLVFGPVEFRRVGILRTRTSDVGTLGCAGIELGLTSRSSRCLDSVSASAFGLALASCGSHCSIRWLRFDCRSDSDHLVFDLWLFSFLLIFDPLELRLEDDHAFVLKGVLVQVDH